MPAFFGLIFTVFEIVVPDVIPKTNFDGFLFFLNL